MKTRLTPMMEGGYQNVRPARLESEVLPPHEVWLDALIKRASSGNVDAQHALAVVYAVGDGVQKDFERALHWFTEAANMAHGGAEFSVALMHREGNGVERNAREAIYWYTRAAESGGAGAQYNLALMRLTGEGVEKSPTQAASWLHKAAAQNLTDAKAALGVLYATGEGVKKDLVQAYMWMTLAEALGHEGALEDCAILESHMNMAQVEEARRLASEWEPEKRPPGEPKRYRRQPR